jgi:uncharacterized integral membrane protein
MPEVLIDESQTITEKVETPTIEVEKPVVEKKSYTDVIIACIILAIIIAVMIYINFKEKQNVSGN